MVKCRIHTLKLVNLINEQLPARKILKQKRLHRELTQDGKMTFLTFNGDRQAKVVGVRDNLIAGHEKIKLSKNIHIGKDDLATKIPNLSQSKDNKIG